MFRLFNKRSKQIHSFILITAFLAVAIFMSIPVNAANDAAAEVQSAADAQPAPTTAPTTARRTRSTGVSLADAVVTAEKIYYCGELYLFNDSMIKLNYEMASLGLEMKDALQSGALTKNRAKLNSMIRKYNVASETYNSWVDVKADLEYFIDVVGARTVMTKSQLQIVFKRTLSVINDAEDMLNAAQVYYENPATDERRELNGTADALIASAAIAVNAITPYAQMAIAAYRSLFDQFAVQAGLDVEYKTWSNPEQAEQ